MQFLVEHWPGELVSETNETTDARFFSLDALPEDLGDFYYAVIEDIRSYDGGLILK